MLFIFIITKFLEAGKPSLAARLGLEIITSQSISWSLRSCSLFVGLKPYWLSGFGFFVSQLVEGVVDGFYL